MKKVFCKPATLDAVKEKKRTASKSKAGAKKRKKAPPLEEVDTSSGIGTLLALEQRIMFDGAALATGAEVVQEQLTQEQATPDQDLAGVDVDAEAETFSNPLTDKIDLSSALSTLSPPSERREIIFIDTGVEDYQTLLLGIDPNAEAILLDSTRDGIEQIAEILGERSDIDAIHIVSHGNQAELFLGTSRLTLESMRGEYADELAVMGQALTGSADLLIYGCNFGEGELGQEAATKMAELTGADVAASTDDTGHADLGGDWDLEYTTGNIESAVVFSRALEDDWSSLLAVINVSQTADVVNGDTSSVANLIASDGGDGISLREAILATNNTAGADNIIVPAGTFFLTIDGDAEGVALTGDLDITDDLTISGAGTGSTILDANMLERMFEVTSGTVTIEDVTIQNGLLTGTGSGGALKIQGGADVTLTRVLVQNNQAVAAGAIDVSDGNLTLVDSTLDGNSTTAGSGGAITIDNNTTATLTGVTISNNTTAGGATLGGGIRHSGTSLVATNVTISGNSTENRGGGLYLAGDATLQNVTVTDNSVSVNDGGGIFIQNSNTVSMRNVLVAGNTAVTEPDVSGTVSSLGNNLIGNSTGSSGWVGSDILDVSPLLGVLADNGGLTQTHALLSGSRGIDEGSNTGAPADDQRGFMRDATTDVGSYEYEVGLLIVDTASDILDGDTSSISALLATKGTDGFISLREAITAANNSANGTNPDEIHFDIAGAGPHTVQVGNLGDGGNGALPTIIDSVIIDGYTQSGASANTLSGGTDAILMIELDGTSAGALANGLLISGTGGGSTIRGLSIQNFDHNGILLQGGSNIIAGNYLGLDADGTTVAGNNVSGASYQGGIRIESANNTIGGLTPGDRNVISGNSFAGIELNSASATGNQVLGNYIGTDAGGTLDRGNSQEGIDFEGGSSNTIGGSTPGARNVISGNDSDGLEIDHGDFNIVQGNYIGTDYTGTLDLGNTRDGIDINEATVDGAIGTLIGGTGANEGNLIFGNDMNGVEVRGAPTNGTSILGNQIYRNGLLGIDLGTGNDGVTANDLPGTWTVTDRDPDSGANNLQNFPVLTSAVTTGTQITIDGTLDSTGSTTFRVEFFWNPTGDGSGNGEGAGYLGATSVTTDGFGHATFSGVMFAEPIAVGADITATATLDLGGGNFGDTSEFSGTFAATGGSTLVVETTNDVIDGTTTSVAALLADRGADGVISLREAITAANNTAGTDTIAFNITEPLVDGAHTIQVGNLGDGGNGLLPVINNNAVIIDGWSEPDFSGTPVIRIDGAVAPNGAGLSFSGTSDGSTVRGLMITGFKGAGTGDGILVQAGADNITIAGNWIGTTGTGSTGVGNQDDGIDLRGSLAIIGGTGANDGNVITNSKEGGVGGGGEGITIVGSGVTGHIIQGNYIGLDPDGSSGSGNWDVGLAIISGSGNTIGGTSAAARNVISNNFEGIEINTDNNIVQGNYIGTDAGGTLDRGNRSDDGVEIQGGATGNLIGGAAADAGNLIAFNALDGVYIVNGSGNSVLGNQIYSNGGLGIDLGVGANNDQSFPVLATADVDSPTQVTIDGTFNSTASTTFRIEFYKNTIATGEDPSNHGEGEIYLDFTTVTTDVGGNGSFNITLNEAVSVGEFVTATATKVDDPGQVGIDDALAYGDTSEFALNVTAVAVNDAPVEASIEGAALAYTENDGAVAITATLAVTDVDDTNIESAVVQITGNYQNGEDVLAFTDQNGISGVWTVGTGTLTLTGTATLANYETALRSLTYENTSADPSNLTRTVSFTVNDGDVDSNTQTRDIAVTVVNDAPVEASIEGAALAYTENDGAVAITATLAVTDVDDTNIESAVVQITGNYQNGEDVLAFTDQNGISGVWTVGTGTLTLTGTATLANYETALRSLTYENTSADPSTLTRTVSFTVNDGDVDSNTQTRDIAVTVVNDAPVEASIEGAALAYTENDGAVAITATLAVTDVDDTNIESAVVQITGNYQNGEDVLAFTDQNGISGVWTVGTGTLTLTGTATLANYETALRSLTYENTSADPSTLTRTVSFTVNDGDVDSNTQTRDIAVTVVNDAPVEASIEGAALAYTENDGAVAITATLAVTDVDDTNIESAVVQITGNYQNGEDVLAFTDQNGISGVWTVGTGTLTLTGTATLANYETALRSLTYENTSADPSTLTRTVSFTVNDGDVDSNTQTRDIAVTVVNDAPVEASIEGAALAYTENDGAVAITATLAVTDVDDTNIESAVVQITGNYQNGEDVLAFTDQNGISGVWTVGTGTLTLTGTATLANYETALRSLTYENTSADPSTLTRTVSFTVNDGDVDSNTQTRDIAVTVVNDAPVEASIEGAALAYTENDGAVAITATLAVTDVDDTNIESAVVQITGNYQNGEDVLAFTDQNGISGVWTVGTGTLTLTGTATLANYETALRSLTYENTSADPSNLTRTVSFTVNDGDVDSNTQTRDIAVTVVNDAPVEASIEGAALAYTENDGAVAITATLAVTDVDDTNIESAVVQITGNYQNGEDVLAFTDQNGISGVWTVGTGTLTLTGTATLANYETALRSLTYENTSADPSTLTRTVSFTVNDGDVDSNTQTRDIAVTVVNDAPVEASIEGAALAYTENDGAVAITATLAVTDVDDTNIESAVVQITGNYQNGEDVLAFTDQNGISGVWTVGTGTLTLTGTATLANYETALRSLTYENTSADPSTLTRTVSFTVNDGDVDSNTQTRDIAVTVVNDAPVEASIEGAALAYTENDGAVAITATLAVTDVDDTNIESAVVQITGNYQNGEDVLAFTDQNGISGVWTVGTGTLTLTGTATLANYETALRSLTYENTSDDPSTLTRTVSFTVNDGDVDSNTQTRDIAVTVVNDAPVEASIEGAALAYTENDGAVAITATLAVTDVDDTNIESAVVQITGNYQNGEDVLAFTDQNGISGVWTVGTGTLTLTGTATLANYETALRSLTYENTSDDPSTLTRTVSFTVNDGTVDSNTQTRDIAVTVVNDAPVEASIEGAALAYTENDGAVAITATLAVTDVDDTNIESAVVQITGNYQNGEDVLAFTDQNGISGVWTVGTGTLTLTGTATLANYETALRSLTYENTSDDPSTLTRTVSFTVNDGTVDSNTQTRDIAVTVVNDAPVEASIEGAALAYTENDGAVAITATLAVTDVDDTNIESAVVQITGNYQNGEDVLAFTDQNGISGVWTVGTGTLTLTGTATLANYETALRSLTYENTSDDPSTLTRTVSFTVNDGTVDSNTQTRDIAVTVVNDAPVEASIEGAALAYTENDGAVAITATLAVTDVDDTNIESAVVQITGNYQNGEDVLAFTDQNGISGVWTVGTGTLTLTGTATLANYETALRSLTYENTSDDPSTLTRTVSFTVNDGTVDSNTQTRDIAVTVVNDAPVEASIEGAALAYTENDGAVAITATLAVTDVDDTNIESAVVQITGNYQNGEDVLAFTDQNGISGVWTVGTGTLTLTGTATLANYETALRSLTYENTSDDPSTLTRTVSFTVNDGDVDSNTQTRDIAVTVVNDAPVEASIEGAALAYTENDGAVAITATLAVTDVDDTNIESAVVQITGNYQNGEDVLAFTDQNGISGVWTVGTGTLTLTGTATLANYETALRSLTYENTSADPSNLTRTVSFTVNDGDVDSNTQTRDIAVTVVNDAPVEASIEGAALAYTENDGAVAITATLAVTDVDDTNIESAVVQITGNYQNGEDVLAFTDQNGISGVWTVGTGTLTLTGTATLANYETALRSLTYENTSADPSTLTRTVSFTVNDGDVDSNTQTRDIAVTAVNDAPVEASIEGAALAYTENDGAVAITATLAVTDVDDTNIESAVVQITGNYQNGEDVLAFTDQNGISGVWTVGTGTLTLTGTATLANYETALRSLTYENTSADPSTLTRTVSFTVNDGDVDSNTQTRDIAVTAVNDAPVEASIEGAALAYTENDGAVAITATLAVTDVDDTNIESAVVQITGNYQNGEDVLAFTDQNGISGVWTVGTGTLTLTGTATLANYETALRSLTYENTSADPSNLTRTVSFTVNDGTVDSNTQTRDIAVTVVNDAPVEASIEGAALAYTENDGAVAITATLAVTDVDDTNIESAVVQITGNYQNGEDVLAFTDQNGISGVWTVGTGTLTLTGTATLANYETALRSLTYENTSADPSNLTRTVSFTVNDGDVDSNTQTRDIAVTVVNDAPVEASIEGAALAYTENDGAVAITATLAVTDVDDTNIESAVVQITGNYQNGEDVLAFTDQNGISGVWTVGTGTLTLTGTATLANYETALRSLTYENTSADPSNLTRTVSFTVNDGDVDSNTQTRDIAVTVVNDAPVEASIEGAALAYTENDGAVAITATLAVTDVDDTNIESAVVQITGNYQNGEDVLAFTDQNGISGVWTVGTGTLTLTGTATLANYETALRSLTYENTSADPSTLTRTVSFTVNDGDVDSNTQTRDIAVTVVNDAPVEASIEGAALAYTENDGAVAITATLAVTDVDDTNIESAVVQITGNYQNGEDVLAFTDQNGISGVWTVGTGTLTLTGTATLANYETALRSLTYENTSADPSTLTRTVSFTVNDGDVDSNTQTRDIAVTVVNDAPVEASIEGAALAYTENDGAVAITATLAVTDVDDTNIESAVVQITGNYQNGEDVLAFTDQNGISGVWTVGTGTLTLTGTATLANYETALRSLTYENTSADPSTLTRTVSFTVNDGDVDSNTQTRDIAVTVVNDAPVEASIEGAALAYTENDGAVAITATLAVTDVDDTNIESAVVQITGNYQNGEDVLAFTDQNGISGVWTVGTGTLTLTGTATLANYETALRSLTYENTSADPSTLTRTVSFTVNDGTVDSNTQTRDIAVTVVNDAPVEASIEGAALAYTENDGAVAITATLAVTDVDDTNIESAVVQITGNYQNGEDVLAFTDQNGISGVWTVGTGTLTLTGTATLANYETALRSLTYENTSDDPSTLTRTVSFTVNDGTVDSNTQTRDIAVTVVNDAPVEASIEGAALAYTENDGAVAITATLAVTDVDDTNIESAVVQITGNYQNGEDVLAFTDQNGISGVWTVGTGTLTLTGTATLANYETALRSLTYENTSDDPSTLTRTVSFTVNDGTVDSNTQTRDIAVTVVNDAPVEASIEGAALAYTENDGAVAITATLAVTDVDDTNIESAVVQITGNYQNGEDVLAFTDQNGISGVWTVGTGTLTLTGTATLANYETALRSLTYENTSDDPSTLTRTVSFTVNDGDVDSNTQTRDIAVTAVNDAPVEASIEGAALAYTENDGAVAITATLAVTDVDDTNIESAVVQITGNYQNGEDVLAFTDQNGISGVWTVGTGTLTLTGTATLANYETALRSLTYENTSADPSTLTRTVSFTVNDGTVDSNTQTRDIAVTAVNDAPVEASIEGAALAYTENDGAVAITATLAVTDVDDTNIESAVVQITGNYQNGEDVLAFTDQNGISGVWTVGTGTLTLTGTATLANYETALRSLTYENTSADPSTLTRTVSFTVNDGTVDSNTQTRDIAVTAVNDAPVLAANNGSIVAEGGTDFIMVAELQVTDVDNTPAQLTYTVTAVPINGQLELTTAPLVAITSFTQDDIDNNRLVYVHNGSQTTSDSFDFTVNDGGGGTIGNTTFVLTVTPVNDAPVIISNGGGATANVNAAENQTSVTTVAATDIDLPPDTLTFSITGGADAARFVIDAATGALRFAVAPDFENPTDAGGDNVYDVQVQVSDGNGGTDTQSLAITVTDLLEGIAPPPPPPPPPPPDPTPEPTPDPEPDPEPPGPSLTGYGEFGGFIGGAPEDEEYLASNRKVGDVLDLSPFLRPASWTTAGQIRAYYGDPLDMTKTDLSTEFLQQLNEFSNELGQTMDEQAEKRSLFVDMIKATGFALSTGLLAWLIRGGALVSSLLASLPAWRHFDPIPILGMNKKDKEAWTRRVKEAGELETREHEGLEQILQKNMENPTKAPAQSPTHFS